MDLLKTHHDNAGGVEEYVHGWENPLPEATIAQLRWSSRTHKPTEKLSPF
jgi:hypothetical protein